jgi:aromatic ring-opening dioxygenase LigB subunit
VTLSGAIVPHAPILLPELASRETRSSSDRLQTALARIDGEDADVVVIVSPHGARNGVYADARASLDGLGVREVEVCWTPEEEAAEEVARRWGRPRLEGPIDHGIGVPLMAGYASGKPIVAAAITDVVASRGSALGDALAAGLALGGAVERLAEHGRVRLVASAHTSAALSPRAPLTERPEARATEERVLEALGSEAGGLVALSRSLWIDGGACGVAVLAMLGRLFSGRGADIVFYECPVGIGYVVASVTRP